MVFISTSAQLMFLVLYGSCCIKFGIAKQITSKELPTLEPTPLVTYDPTPSMTVEPTPSITLPPTSSDPTTFPPFTDFTFFPTAERIPCYICSNSSEYVVTNPEVFPDTSFLGFPPIDGSCGQLDDFATFGFFSADQCELFQTDPDGQQLQIDCGCRNDVYRVLMPTLSRIFYNTTSDEVPDTSDYDVVDALATEYFNDIFSSSYSTTDVSFLKHVCRYIFWDFDRISNAMITFHEYCAVFFADTSDPLPTKKELVEIFTEGIESSDYLELITTALPRTSFESVYEISIEFNDFSTDPPSYLDTPSPTPLTTDKPVKSRRQRPT